MPDRDQSRSGKFLAGGGEMGALMRNHDWSATGLGDPEHWPQALKTVVRLMLNTGHPVFVFWGPEAISLYNDAYARTMGSVRHPWALGRPGRDVWAEIWDTIEPQVSQVMRGGEATWNVNQRLEIWRNGRLEESFWTYSHGPVDDDTAVGGVGGVLVLVTETTEEVKIRRHAEEEAYRFSQLFLQAPTFMVTMGGPDHRIEFVNPAAYEILAGRHDIIGRTVAEALPEAVEQGFLKLLDDVYVSGEPYNATGARYALQVDPDGPITERYLDFVYQPVKDLAGSVVGIFCVGYDVTSSVKSVVRKEALASSTARIQELDNPDDIAFAAAAIVGQTLEVSRVAYALIDKENDVLTVKHDWHVPGVPPIGPRLDLRDFGTLADDMRRGEYTAIADVRFDSRTTNSAAEAFLARNTRSLVNVPVIEEPKTIAVFYLNAAEVRDWSEDDLAFLQDVAHRTRTAIERQRAEASLAVLAASLESQVEARTAELQRAEEELRQSQKMEAVGQLTGGIAHDFNNLLAGITGSLQLLQARVAQGRVAEVGRYVEAATGAAQRAASLTQRLLAFSRQQTLDPKPLDMNRLVAGMEDLVRRTVGPHIVVEVVGAVGLWTTLADPGQLENALLNLCINARDAMSAGGQITIRTANKWLDDRLAREQDLPPGQYVALHVTDTGTGMAPDVIARAFDPFFTTKPLGVGTGLGLSMVYGFARQTGGQVRIDSELDHGTTMSIYLPRYRGDDPALAPIETEKEAGVKANAGETVLILDDEPLLRMMMTEVLEDAGFQIIEAATGPAALTILESATRIDLLITDVGLPGGMNGRQVADAARQLRPDLKVLFVTGYAANSVIANGQIDPGTSVLTKPFAVEELEAKVHDMLRG